jgi:Golgi phosphoprotein 3
MSSGLQRRRVGGGSNDEDDSAQSSITNGGNSRSSTTDPSPQPSYHAGGSAFEFSGGNRIAYDPRDLQDAAGEEAKVGGKLPKLTLMEEIMLLGVKDKQASLGRDLPPSRSY